MTESLLQCCEWVAHAAKCWIVHFIPNDRSRALRQIKTFQTLFCENEPGKITVSDEGLTYFLHFQAACTRVTVPCPWAPRSLHEASSPEPEEGGRQNQKYRIIHIVGNVTVSWDIHYTLNCTIFKHVCTCVYMCIHFMCNIIYGVHISIPLKCITSIVLSLLNY